jgi:3'(2'), 5'-bisphosphate nucleotidase
MTDYSRERDVAVAAVRRAGRLCAAVQAGLAGRALDKADRTPVTVADFGSQAVICRLLQEAFPDDAVVGEESSALLRAAGNEPLLADVAALVGRLTGDADEQAVCGWIDRGGGEARGRFWALDPLDGTKGFLRSDQYAVALALVVDGRPVVAALACPNLASDGGGRGAVFSAVRGAGAQAHGVDEDAASATPRNSAHRPSHEDRSPARARFSQEVRPVTASTVSDPAAARLCEPFEPGHGAQATVEAVAARLGIHREPLRVDSQAKYALVARGDAEAYLRLSGGAGYVERIWDHAAGALLLEEAGGTVTDTLGRPLDFGRGRGLEGNRGVVATNGRFHDAVLAALAAEGVGAE